MRATPFRRVQAPPSCKCSDIEVTSLHVRNGRYLEVYRRAFPRFRSSFGVARVGGSCERGLWEEKQHVTVVWGSALRVRGDVGRV